MDELLITVGVIVGVALLVVPVVALILAMGAGRRAQEARLRIGALEWQLYHLRQHLDYLAGQQQQLSAEVAKPQQLPAAEDGAESSAEASASDTVKMIPAEAPAGAELASDTVRVEQPAAGLEAAAGLAARTPAQVDEAAAAPAAMAAAIPGVADPAAAGRPAAPGGPPPPAGDAPGQPHSIEERIGLVWFTRIGAVIGIMAAGWGFKYLVDNDWVGPWGRVGLGYLAGLVLLGWGELMAHRKKSHVLFIQGILGLALALLLMSTYAASSFYQLVPVVLAFAVVAVLSVLGGVLAIRHRAEAILVLSLFAALLNPVFLSTGSDRALALMSYLLVMTSGAFVVGVRYRFRVAVGISLAGILALLTGWYLRYFDISPVAGDEVARAGAYEALADRWVPLLFALLFPLQWAAAGIFAGRRGHSYIRTGLLLCGAVASHAAYTALLYDHQLLLGGVLCGLALIFAALFLWYDLSRWLGLPMLASFVVLVGLAQVAPEFSGRLSGLLIISGCLWLVYFGVFLRGATRDKEKPSPLSLALCGGAGLGLAVMGALLLLPEHFWYFALLLTGLSLIYLLVTMVTRSVAMLVAGFVITLVGLSGTSSFCAGDFMGFLIVSGIWCLLYLGFVSYDMLLRRLPWNNARLGVLAGAGLEFGALFMMTTAAQHDLLRALLSLGTGALYMVLGVLMLRRPEGEDRALLPLGLALAFFTLAAALLLSGPSVTVVWAVEGAVLAFLATRMQRKDQRGHPLWLVLSLLVFFISVIRLAAYDIPWISQQQELFSSSLGTEGSLEPTAFLHPRAWALAALGAGMLGAGLLCGRTRHSSFFRVTGLCLCITGHLALLGLWIGEARILMTSLPDLPVGLAAEQFAKRLGQIMLSLEAQATGLQMITTMVLGLYAIVLLTTGFIFRDRNHRIFGIALFGLTLLKLGLWDIWSLETVHKIAVGGAIAVLLLAGGYLYGRFSHRIRTLLTEDSGAAGWILLLAGASLLVPATAGAVDRHDYRARRSILGVQSAGDHRLVVDPALYGAVLTGRAMADVRIVGPDNKEVRFVRRPFSGPAHAARGSVSLRATAGPGAREGETVYTLARLPRGLPVTALRLQVETSEFVRRVQVDASTTRHAWFGVGHGLVSRVAVKGARPAQLKQHLELQIDPAEHPHLRLTVDDGDNAPLKLSGARALYATEELVFRVDRPGAHTLLVGRPQDRPPRYDLAELLELGGAQDIRAATLGPVERNPLFGKGRPQAAPEPAAAQAPWSERHQRMLKLIIGAAVLLLAAWTIWLLRRGRTRREDKDEA